MGNQDLRLHSNLTTTGVFSDKKTYYFPGELLRKEILHFGKQS